jgi:hypothetical protein
MKGSLGKGVPSLVILGTDVVQMKIQPRFCKGEQTTHTKNLVSKQENKTFS